MKAGLPLFASALALAACASSSQVAPPAPAPVTEPAADPTPALPSEPQTVPDDRWMDQPATPGEWRYAPRGTGSEAGFWSPAGTPLARLRCMADTRTVVLALPVTGARAPLVTIRTETATRTLAAVPADREMTVSLVAGDPLLDAMALSKGRFALESEGLPPLSLPSWAEVTRVIEDCR